MHYRSPSKNLNDNVPLARGAQLNQENALPAPELKMTLNDRHRFAGREKEMTAVRVPIDGFVRRQVVPPRQIVVLVEAVTRRHEPVETTHEVLEQQFLVFV